MIFLLAAQANQVANNWPQIESRIKAENRKRSELSE
jgi:hypothetical protein